MRTVRTIVSLALLVLLVMGGCSRNQPSDQPPIHLVGNMDDQPKYKPQGTSDFFADGQAMRQPVEGTVARGWLREDSAFFYEARDLGGNLVVTNPLRVTMELMERGRERFDIFCAPCHGRTGDGQSMLVKKGMLPPPSFYEDRLIDSADGYFFDVVSNGLRNMPPYKYQISAKDRWAIVAYLRALQKSQRVRIEDLSAEQLEKLEQ